MTVSNVSSTYDLNATCCEAICDVTERAKISGKEYIKLKRIYCMDTCRCGCTDSIMLKKIYWELRKLNEVKK